MSLDYKLVPVHNWEYEYGLFIDFVLVLHGRH